MLDDVVEENQARLVTVDVGPHSAVVLAGHAHAVGIGVGRHHEVGPLLVGQTNGQIEGFGILRVGKFHRGEIAVRHHLLRHTIDLVEAPLPQTARDELHPCPVQRAVHDF